MRSLPGTDRFTYDCFKIICYPGPGRPIDTLPAAGNGPLTYPPVPLASGSEARVGTFDLSLNVRRADGWPVVQVGENARDGQARWTARFHTDKEDRREAAQAMLREHAARFGRMREDPKVFHGSALLPAEAVTGFLSLGDDRMNMTQLTSRAGTRKFCFTAEAGGWYLSCQDRKDEMRALLDSAGVPCEDYGPGWCGQGTTSGSVIAPLTRLAVLDGAVHPGLARIIERDGYGLGANNLGWLRASKPLGDTGWSASAYPDGRRGALRYTVENADGVPVPLHSAGTRVPHDADHAGPADLAIPGYVTSHPDRDDTFLRHWVETAGLATATDQARRRA